jgi:hypothetical protein
MHLEELFTDVPGAKAAVCQDVQETRQALRMLESRQELLDEVEQALASLNSPVAEYPGKARTEYFYVHSYSEEEGIPTRIRVSKATPGNTVDHAKGRSPLMCWYAQTVDSPTRDWWCAQIFYFTPDEIVNVARLSAEYVGLSQEEDHYVIF